MQLALNAKRTPHLSAGRWYRPAMLGLTVLTLVAAAVVFAVRYATFEARGLVGVDLALFSEIGRRFLETGTIYAPFQLAGPYSYEQAAGTTDVGAMPALYPPFAGPFFAVVRFLPPILWWVIPLAVTAWLVAAWRPAPWTWPLMALAFLWPNTAGSLIAGNTTMWIVMLTALGLRYRWPVALVALKPTFLPLVLIGWRDWRTWAVLAVLAALALPQVGPYLAAMQNVEGASLAYSLGDLPLVAVPIAAFVASHGRAQRPIES